MLLRLVAAAYLGTLTNIEPDSGFISMAWHSDPSLLRRDAYSADFGPGFFGAALLAGAHLAFHEPFGWVCLVCDLEVGTGGGAGKEVITVRPRDAYRRTFFAANPGVLVELQGAELQACTVDYTTSCMGCSVSAAHPAAESASISVTTTAVEDSAVEGLTIKCCAAHGANCIVHHPPTQLDPSDAGGGFLGSLIFGPPDGPRNRTRPSATLDVDVCWTGTS